MASADRLRPPRSTHAYSRCYEPAHIAVISKTTYSLATRAALAGRHGLPRTSTNSNPPYPIEHRHSARRPHGARAPSPPPRRSSTDEIPAVANLDPDLLGALRRAATDAAADGSSSSSMVLAFPEYQEQLLRAAVSKYGSAKEAARWVATAETSAHVSGDAGRHWTRRCHGVAVPARRRVWTLPIYRNEPWHYELRLEAIEHGCPPMYADPTHDPRCGSDQHSASRGCEGVSASGWQEFLAAVSHPVRGRCLHVEANELWRRTWPVTPDPQAELTASTAR